jgi:hypothetical protein
MRLQARDRPFPHYALLWEPPVSRIIKTCLPSRAPGPRSSMLVHVGCITRTAKAPLCFNPSGCYIQYNESGVISESLEGALTVVNLYALPTLTGRQ